MKISDGKFVSLTYDLNVGEGDERELMEKATLEQPLTFMFGMGMMLEAFEKQVEGLQVGENFAFSLTPEEAYGEFEDSAVVELPKNIFEIDGKFDETHVKAGETLPMMDSNGNRMMGTVEEVKENVVVMNFNHPLAGETLHFEGSVIEVREPSAEEIAALTAGVGCGCGCDSCDSDCDCGEDGGCGSKGCNC